MPWGFSEKFVRHLYVIPPRGRTSKVQHKGRTTSTHVHPYSPQAKCACRTFLHRSSEAFGNSICFAPCLRSGLQIPRLGASAGLELVGTRPIHGLALQRCSASRNLWTSDLPFSVLDLPAISADCAASLSRKKTEKLSWIKCPQSSKAAIAAYSSTS